MSDVLTIPAAYNGPPTSGHGGYTCGAVASLIDGTATVTVTLRSPPPLNVAMDVERSGDGPLVVRANGTVVAEGISATLDVDAPAPVDFDAAVESSTAYAGFQRHPFPTCFACGPDRAPGDGLRIFPGRVAGRDAGAAPWVPDGSLSGPDGVVDPRFVWAALDCAAPWGAWSVEPTDAISVLGRMTLRRDAAVRSGNRYVVVGWPLGRQGRKFWCGSALFGASGELVAVAHTTWIELREPPATP